jgi:predicted AAA+ superfamily ATPase
MKRKVHDKLRDWKNDSKRLPLVITGARQIGKTYSVQEFANSEYDDFVNISLDKEDNVAKLFEQNIDPERLIVNIGAVKNKKIIPGKTLIFFDEVQKVPRALESLKYFAENFPQHHIIAAGSLLGVAIHRDNVSFPVGKVQRLEMFPFDFEEYLWSQGADILAGEIASRAKTLKPIEETLHLKALEHMKNFFITGGLPASINAFNEKSSFIDSGKVIKTIAKDYLADMNKYASSSERVKIRKSFESIPRQLSKKNKKFMYSLVERNGTGSKFEAIIEWLLCSGLVIKCNNIETDKIPLAVYENSGKFKLYMGDIGLLISMGKLPLGLVLDFEHVENIFLGSVAENYIATVLNRKDLGLRYWTSGNEAEVDFIIQGENEAIPIEVKKGYRVTSHSLKEYDKKFHPKKAIRFSAKNFGKMEKLMSVPLYAAEWFL